MPLNRYDLLLLDCDGVLLDSNQAKTDAFYLATESFGKEKAQALKEYHKTHGGIARQAKFRHFIEDILNQEFDQSLYDSLLKKYAEASQKFVQNCATTPALNEFLNAIKNQEKHIVSGGKESELVAEFKRRKLDHLFDGIFGNPRDKFDIINDLGISTPKDKVLFIGDSKFDHEVAAHYGYDFIFMFEFTEFQEWEEYCEAHHIRTIKNLSALI